MKKISNNGVYGAKNVIFWIACFVLVAGFSLVILEKTHVTNFYTKPADSTNTGEVPGTRPVNTVDYSPATSSEKPDISQKTQDTQTQSTETSPQTDNSATVILNAAGQDLKGGPVIVRAKIEGLNGGSCTVKLVKDGVAKTYSSVVAWNGSFYSCNDFNIPFSDLSVGTWSLSLTATQNAKNGMATQDVIVQAP